MGFVDFLRKMLGWWSGTTAAPPAVRSAVYWPDLHGTDNRFCELNGPDDTFRELNGE